MLARTFCTSFPSDSGEIISPSFVLEVGEGRILFMIVGGGVGSLVGDNHESPVLLLAMLCSASAAMLDAGKDDCLMFLMQDLALGLRAKMMCLMVVM